MCPTTQNPINKLPEWKQLQNAELDATIMFFLMVYNNYGLGKKEMKKKRRNWKKKLKKGNSKPLVVFQSPTKKPATP